MTRVLAIATLALLAGGCASVFNDPMQPVKLETKRADGTFVSGADCQISNDFSFAKAKSGGIVQVRRSAKVLEVVCMDPGQPNAVGRAISRANAGMAGNILLGGGIGMVIDHTKGTAYTYPTWMQLEFGKTLVFDRQGEKEGEPVAGIDPLAPKQTR